MSYDTDQKFAELEMHLMVAEVCAGAAALLDRGHTIGENARNRNGRPVHSTDRTAVCWCPQGAILGAADRLGLDYYQSTYEADVPEAGFDQMVVWGAMLALQLALKDEVDWRQLDTLTSWNDRGGTHRLRGETSVAALRRAAKAERARGRAA